MRATIKLAAAFSLALSGAAAATASHADTFATWLSAGFSTNFLFKNNGVDTNADGFADSGTGGTFFTTASANANTLGATSIFFSLADFPSLRNIPAKLTFSSTVTNTPATFSVPSGTYTQTGINGNFTIIYTGATHTYGTTVVHHNANLLSGGFTDAWIQGDGSSGGIDLSIDNGGSMSTPFTSDFEDFSNISPASENFNITLGAATTRNGTRGGIRQAVPNNGHALQTFRAVGAGGFQDSPVPEPAIWALMISGFGGVGIMLRQRRHAISVAG